MGAINALKVELSIVFHTVEVVGASLKGVLKGQGTKISVQPMAEVEDVMFKIVIKQPLEDQ